MRFAGAQERNLCFAARAAETLRRFDQPIRAHKAMCRTDEFGCQHMIAGMEHAKGQELSRLEALHEATPAALPARGTPEGRPRAGRCDRFSDPRLFYSAAPSAARITPRKLPDQSSPTSRGP
jgi:hypothetical protein